MRINSIHIQNFKGIADLSLELDPQLNVFIGENGSGKTALLEALVVAVGSVFIGMRDVATRGIGQNEVRFSVHQEFQYPVAIEANGLFGETEITWSRERNSQKGSTTTRNAKEISDYGRWLEEAVRKGEPIPLPLISYFSTGRLFVLAQSRSSSQLRPAIGKEIGSRFRGYRQSLEAKSNFKRFADWFQQKEISQLQKREEDLSLRLVKQAIISTLPDCENVFYDFDPDTNRGISVQLSDGRTLPFDLLSDGVRSFFALMADLAYRCVLLNPHLGERALLETRGVVLIDELDLHLHPSWQKIVLRQLLQTFPKLQFMVSTHSPFLIQETATNQLIRLEDCQVVSRQGASEMSIEDIAEYLQGVEMPQWSQKRKEMFDIAKAYYEAVENGTVNEALEARFQKSMQPFSPNTAYHAILEQERILKAYKEQNG